MRVVKAARSTQVNVVYPAVKSTHNHRIDAVPVLAVQELLPWTVVDDCPRLSLKVNVHAINTCSNIQKSALLINLINGS